jgi:hypothetical protein
VRRADLENLVTGLHGRAAVRTRRREHLTASHGARACLGCLASATGCWQRNKGHDGLSLGARRRRRQGIADCGVAVHARLRECSRHASCWVPGGDSPTSIHAAAAKCACSGTCSWACRGGVAGSAGGLCGAISIEAAEEARGSRVGRGGVEWPITKGPPPLSRWSAAPQAVKATSLWTTSRGRHAPCARTLVAVCLEAVVRTDD